MSTLNKVGVGYDTDVMISAKDAEDITGMSKVEIRKAIKTSGIEAIAEVHTNKKGRPPKLYGRADLLAVISEAKAGMVSTPTVASEVAADLSTETSTETESTESTKASSDFDDVAA